ncbi:TPA: hypothetical protein GXZ54_04200, partial [bacterium]|nr:hypothetical protein [bacterium]
TYQARLHTTTGYPGSNGDFRSYLTSDSYQFSINEDTSTNLNEPGTISNYSETMSGLLPRFVSSINVSGANIDAYLLYVYQSDNIVTGYPLFLTSAQMSELTIRNLYLVGGDTELVDYTFRFVPLRSNTIDLGNRLITVYAVNRETPYTDQTIGITNRTWYILGYGDGNGRANANPSSYVDSVIESISVSFENVENATWYSLYVYDSNNNLVNGYPRPAKSKSNIINFNQLDLIEGEGYKLKVVANGDGCYSSPLGSSKELNFKVTNVPQSKVQNSKPIIYAKLDWDFSEQTDIPDNAYIETEEPIYDVKVIEYYHGLWRDDANAQYKIQYKYYSENGETYEWEDLTGPITITNPNLTFTSVNIPEYIETYRGIYIRFIAEGRTNRVILDDIKFLHDRSGLQKVNATKELINNTIKSTYNQNDVIILPNVGSFNTLINWIAIGDNSSRIDLEKGLFDKSEETYTITLIATIIDPLTQTTSELEKEIVVNPVMNYGRIGPVFDVENMEDVIPLASTGAKIDSSYLELTWSTSNVTSYNESGLTNGNYSLAIGSPLGTGHITSEFSLTNIGKINFSYGLYGTSSNVSYRISYSNNLDTWYEIVTESISNTNINNGQLYTKSINLPFNTSEGVYFRFETLSNGGLIIDDLSFEINEYEKLLQATTSLGNVFTINYNMFDVVTLWKHGSYESNINWRYSNGDYILDDFLYLDYDDEGYSINLTAELSINELTRSVDFVINVLELDKYLDLGNVYDGENFINEDILPSEGALLGAGSSQVTWKTLLAFGYNEDFGRYNGEYAIRIGNPAFIAYIYQEEIINGTTRDVLVHGYPREIIEGTGLDELNLPNGEYTISIVATDILNHPTALVSNSFKFTINDSYDDVRERLSVGVTRETRVLFEPLENADYYLAFIYDDQNKEISGSPFKITNGYDISTLKLPNGKYQIEIVGVAKLDEEYMDSLPSQRFEFYIFGSDVVFSEEKLNINSISFNNNTLNFSVDNITKDNALGYQIYAYKKDNNELRKITGSPYFVENNNTNNYAINLANVFPDGDYVFGVKAIGYDLESGYGEYKDSDILTTNTSTLLSIRYSNVIKSNERLTRSSSSSYLTNPIINQIISDAGTNGTGTVVYRMSEDAFKHIVEDEDGNFVLNKNVYAYYVIHSLETSFGASIYSHEDEDYYFELRRTDFNNYIRVPIGEITV